MSWTRLYSQRRSEYSIALLLILSVFVTIQVAYLLGEWSKPEGTFFIGHPYPLDANIMLGKCLYGARHGVIFYQSTVTTEPHPPAPLFNHHLLAGKLASLLRLEFLTVFHLIRILAGVAFLVYLYGKSRYFFRDGCARLGMLAIVCFSSGFEAISEANTFRSLALFPQVPLSLLLMVVYYWNFHAFCAGRRLGPPLLACMAAIFAMGVVHPWNLLSMGAVSAGFLGLIRVRKRGLFKAGRVVGFALMALVAATMVGMHLHTKATNPVFGVVAEQNQAPVRGWGEWVSFFGFLWLTAAGGAALAVRDRKRRPFIFLAVWAATTCVLMTLPFPFRRRLVEGVHVPVAILTAYFLFEAVGWAASRTGRPKRACLIAASLWLLAVTVRPNVSFLRFPYFDGQSSPIYYPPAEIHESLRWIDENLPEGARIMAGVWTGHLLGRYTLARPFVVHPVETVDFQNKCERMRGFYSGQDPPDAMRSFLGEYGIDYVFSGPFEPSSRGFKPWDYPWLELCYRDRLALIYRVGKPGP
jgi:hypothetical protein